MIFLPLRKLRARFSIDDGILRIRRSYAAQGKNMYDWIPAYAGMTRYSEQKKYLLER